MSDESKVFDLLPDWLALRGWQYTEFFDPIDRSELHPVVKDIEAEVLNARLDEHDFFELAAQSKAALYVWVSQELVMTNAFSQLVLRAASQIPNVHARAILTEVAFGEHGRARGGVAKVAHPWLLERLRNSVALPRAQVAPAAPTLRFIHRLASSLNDPLTATAFIGVGNERLIDPEYRAIENCFETLFPGADFGPFLHANLNEDIEHSKQCYELATIMIADDFDAAKYLSAAKASIASRVVYFDELLEFARRNEAHG